MSPRLQSETARQRELYKYWQPNESIFPSADYDESFNHDYQPRPSYDAALTAYAQLGALRCNTKRGIISVVDQHYQYIIAEGTKTLSLQDGSVTDQDDQLWFGLRTIPRAMGICATALTQFTTVEANDGSIPDKLFEPLQYIIPDLSKDARFANQPFVCGPPYLRFYAGVPIRSPAGFIIGIYSIVDDKPRENFGEHDLNILKDLAATVMDHLVLGTVRGRHHRADRMVKGLGLFVEGKSTLRDWWLRSGHLAKGPTTKDGSRGEWTLKAQADAEFGPQSEATLKTQNGASAIPGLLDTTLCSVVGNPASVILPLGGENPHKISRETSSEEKRAVKFSIPEHVSEITISDSLTQNTNSSDSSRQGAEDISKRREAETLSISQDMAALFKRASNLIRESIAVEGCLFLDAGPVIIGDTPTSPRSDNREMSTSRRMSFKRRSTGGVEGPALNTIINGTTSDPDFSYFHRGSASQESICKVLGYSSMFDPHLSDGVKSEIRLPRELLHRLFNRYPNGNILNFEHDGSISSSEEDLNGNTSDNLASEGVGSKSWNKKRERSLRELDAKIIMDTFPGIRCLAFFPLWDSGTNSWFCGALAWTNDPLRVLDPDDDMAYLAAFGNSIMAEKARLDASMADRMKGNFISTVSHELRSPLHGILASAELLKDMSTSPAQIDVISMINICGRTLLDTINHVLDFTELNRFRKSKPSEKKKLGDREVPKKQTHSTYSLSNQLANLDLGLLVEEVVESTLAGYGFGQSESAAMLSSDSQLPSHGVEMRSHVENVLYRSKSRIKVIVDVEWRPSWVFAIQPGAWRRILMNLFGNALKYTKEGCICVSLKSIANVSNQDNRPSVILTVSDTGKGISKQFLKHHIFTPFLQEDSLATGTGLGLSIVQQIVHDLDGQIEVKSEEGSGTKVTVQIPFALPTSSHLNGDDAHLESVRQKLKGLKVYLALSEDYFESRENVVSRITDTDATCLVSMKKSLRNTLKHWFEMDVVEAPSLDSADADVYLLLEDKFGSLGMQESNRNLAWKPKTMQLAKSDKLIVLSTSPASLSKTVFDFWKMAHFIQQPFGPHKLAREFSSFLDKKTMPQPSLSEVDSAPIDEFPLDCISTISKSPEHLLSSVTIQETELTVDSNIISLSTTTIPLLIKSPEPPVQSGLPTVLLVDDNEINLKLLVMYMRKLKHPYQTAVNGLEALQTFKKDPLPYRLILMDISMPIMDGLASTREIRKYERELGLPPATIIALTGASSANAQEKAISSGIDRFLTKPVPLNLVREIVNGYKQHFI